MDGQGSGPRGRRDLLGSLPGSDEFERLLAEQGAQEFAPISSGDRVKGRIVSVGSDSVLVDIGQRSEGVVPLEAFTEAERAQLAVGQEAEFAVTRIGGGGIELARSVSARGLDMQALTEAMRAGLTIEAKVTGENKGGFSVELPGGKGFVPFSQMELGAAQPAADYLGRSLQFRVLEIRGKDVILSRAALLREERDAARRELVKTLAEGQVVDATVVKHERFGIFVDLGGGVNALVPASELSWSRSGDALRDAPKVGDVARVKILKVEESKDRPRISASIKQVGDDPWTGVAERFAVGQKVEGRVARIAPFGAFVEIGAGIEGLLHVSEIGTTKRIQHPGEVVRPGQVLEVTITAIDAGARRVSLSTKSAPEDAIDDDTRARYMPDPAKEAGGGFGQMAEAFRKLQQKKK